MSYGKITNEAKPQTLMKTQASIIGGSSVIIKLPQGTKDGERHSAICDTLILGLKNIFRMSLQFDAIRKNGVTFTEFSFGHLKLDVILFLAIGQVVAFPQLLT